MATLPLETRDAFRLDHGAAMQAFTAGIVPARARSRDASWLLWESYCAEHQIDPFLTDVVDTLPVIQVFAERYRSGAIAPNKKPVKSRTVETALRAISQTFTSMGSPDPCLNSFGTRHYVLQQQLRGYARADPSAIRVQPIPFPLVTHTITTALTLFDQATAELAVIGFFFLLRPGEHTHGTPSSNSHPFRLCDVVFRIGSASFSAATGDLLSISRASFVALTFTTQKNGTENEVIGHGRSGHSATCPVLALIRRCTHLRLHSAPPTTPLCTVYLQPHIPTFIYPIHLTALLRRSATILLPSLGFNPSNVSARSLRAGGAMALLGAHVDAEIIKLVGRWRSDEMLRYLHPQCLPKMQSLAPLMANGGNFRNNIPPPPPAAP